MGNIMGEKGRVGAVLGNWDRMEGGEAFSERVIWCWQGSARALWWRCYPGCVQGSPPLPLFLGGTSPSHPPHLLLPFSHITPS